MLLRIIKIEEIIMTLRDNSFVAKPEYISSIKSPVLQKLLKTCREELYKELGV